eukprot:Lithocolla_globosa_v1_NODE_1276_length_2703_cov_31.340883.p1 type:complete len:868 gc:universal NODE_1276_length_2703_cov_31.340883:39-2642(+)
MMWVFLLFFVLGADSQICNRHDPKSGGLFVPAFSSGGALATLGNGTEVFACELNTSDITEGNLYGCVEAENDPQPMAILYLLLLLWMFLAVAIIADVFMGSIEVITSESKIVEVKEGEETAQVEVMIWNSTVANLTLMALGSSAPEILLSLIELLGNNFYAGALGPGTIVGSAAFNLMCIIAVCFTAIPKENLETGETGFRKVKEVGVFAITSVFSVLAYVWLAIILLVVTPDVISIGEAAITFLLFPILVLLAYMADKGVFSRGGVFRADAPHILEIEEVGDPNHAVPTFKTGVEYTPEQVNFMLRGVHAKRLKPEEVASLLEMKVQKKKSRAMYRMQASRQIVGGRPVFREKQDNLLPTSTYSLPQVENERGTIRFAAHSYQVLESCGEAVIYVERVGNPNGECEVYYHTEDGAAKSGEDYVAVSDKLTFAPGEIMKPIPITIVDDTDYEPDENFSVVLTDCQTISEPPCVLSTDHRDTRTDVLIIDDDQPGIISMATTETGKKSTEYVTSESIGFVNVRVVRREGTKGKCSVDYTTKDGTALAVHDYEAKTGTLYFEPGEVEKSIQIKIIDNEEYEKEEQFTVWLSNPVGAKLGKQVTAFITIGEDEDIKNLSDKVTALLALNLDQYRVGSASWAEQFSDAVEIPEGSVAKCFHFISLPWKLLFAFCPPTAFWGGYLTFFIALVFIGIMTALIGDLAALLGCSVGLKDSVTAITIVALGTSLPDTFASRTAAVMDTTADNSLGNVTGSNSVNVFLGLGIGWLVCAVYWSTVDEDVLSVWRARVSPEIVELYPNGAFNVPASDLGFTVIVFIICALVCLFSLVFKRIKWGSELGGPYSSFFSGMFVLIWFTYVMLSSLNSYGKFQ